MVAVVKKRSCQQHNKMWFFVVFSVLELTINGDGRLSILRAFRLLRFVRLVYFLPYLKCQLLVLKRTMEEAASLCGLLLFVTFIFRHVHACIHTNPPFPCVCLWTSVMSQAIPNDIWLSPTRCIHFNDYFFVFLCSVLGMHLFGGTFTSETENGDNTQRSNFDTLLWSMVTVFQVSFWLHNLCHYHCIQSSCNLWLNPCLCYSLQLNTSIQILTQEDWNLVLYNAMSATSPWAALYFTSVIVLGKHVILNVLVGIVVQSFQARVSTTVLVFSKSFIKKTYPMWLLSKARSNTSIHT